MVFWIILIFLFADIYPAPSGINLCFRESALVNDTIFRICDIADVTGDDISLINQLRNMVAGTTAPPGCSRFFSTDDFILFNLKNRFPGISFSLSGSKRPLIRTDYKVVKISDYEKAFRDWVDSVIGWNAGDWIMTIENVNDSCKVLNAPVFVSFRGLEDRFPKGLTNIGLLIKQGSRNYKLSIKAFFSVTLPVIVARNTILRGSIIPPEDCTTRRMDITRFAPRPVTSLEELKNKRAGRTINSGTVLHENLLINIPVIEKGDAVSIIYKSKLISVTVAGVARDKGGVGDRIWVENKLTRKLIRVRIMGKGIVSPLEGGVSI